MRNFIVKIGEFVSGFAVIFALYGICGFILKTLKIPFPPAILALIMFTVCLLTGIVKEKYVKTTAEFMMKNMPVLFVPFVVGLISYKTIFMKNALAISLVVFVSTTVTIVVTGLFTEYGVKLLRASKIRGKND